MTDDASLARIAATAEALLAAARDAGMTVTGDGRVKEADANVSFFIDGDAGAVPAGEI